MLNRDERTAARIRLERDIFVPMIAAGFIIYLPDHWAEHWDREFKNISSGRWLRIILNAKYGTMNMTMEINRDNSDSYDFEARVYKVGLAWIPVWTFAVYASGRTINNGFKFSKLMEMGPEEVPF
jgi:hypothetical protein